MQKTHTTYVRTGCNQANSSCPYPGIHLYVLVIFQVGISAQRECKCLLPKKTFGCGTMLDISLRLNICFMCLYKKKMKSTTNRNSPGIRVFLRVKITASKRTPLWLRSSFTQPKEMRKRFQTHRRFLGLNILSQYVLLLSIWPR